MPHFNTYSKSKKTKSAKPTIVLANKIVTDFASAEPDLKAVVDVVSYLLPVQVYISSPFFGIGASQILDLVQEAKTTI